MLSGNMETLITVTEN